MTAPPTSPHLMASPVELRPAMGLLIPRKLRRFSLLVVLACVLMLEEEWSWTVAALAFGCLALGPVVVALWEGWPRLRIDAVEIEHRSGVWRRRVARHEVSEVVLAPDIAWPKGSLAVLDAAGRRRLVLHGPRWSREQLFQVSELIGAPVTVHADRSAKTVHRTDPRAMSVLFGRPILMFVALTLAYLALSVAAVLLTR